MPRSLAVKTKTEALCCCCVWNCLVILSFCSYYKGEDLFFAKIKSYSPRYIQDAALEKSVCTSWGVDSHHESASLYLMARKQYDMRSLLNAWIKWWKIWIDSQVSLFLLARALDWLYSSFVMCSCFLDGIWTHQELKPTHVLPSMAFYV